MLSTAAAPLPEAVAATATAMAMDVSDSEHPLAADAVPSVAAPAPLLPTKKGPLMFTLQELASKWDGQRVICRFDNTPMQWTKGLVITTIPPKYAHQEWEFVVYTEEDNWRHILKTKATGPGNTFERIQEWTSDADLELLNAQLSDADVIRSNARFEHGGGASRRPRRHDRRTEFIAEQYDKAVSSLRKSLQVSLLLPVVADTQC